MNIEDDVLVSICCITYNHASFIRQCLDGFIMQETDFAFEVLIHDDASTDDTADIIREYESKYPDIIKPIYQTENQWVKGKRGSAVFNFPRAKGEYIALCEGDDYWTDPLKLQKQVEFMEENEDCSLCFHASKNIRNNNPEDYSINRPIEVPQDKKFEMKDAILGGGEFMATNSMLFYSKDILERPSWMQEAPVGDLPLMLLLASKGRIGYIDDIMSVYRIMSSPSSWSATIQDPRRKKEHYYAILKMWRDFDEWSEDKYHNYVVKKIRVNRNTYLKGKVKDILNRIIR